ncbi:MAG: zf-HC2 domain-containing protein [Acidobacteria bacterium]|nr:zf-HC2 domain-containing protein [Acidobacteriota bacterium]
MKNICTPIRERFSAYLDCDLNGREMQQVEAHLDTCPACRSEFAEWKEIQSTLHAAGQLKAPVDLALRLRLAISRERSAKQRSLGERLMERWELLRDNTLRPFAVQGAVTATAILILVAGLSFLSAMAAAPTAVEANDEPLAGFSSPRYLYNAAGTSADQLVTDQPLVVEADVNAQGRVYDFHILSGPTDHATASAVRDRMLHAVFEPAQVFGVPVKGHVVLTFSGISVRG